MFQAFPLILQPEMDALSKFSQGAKPDGLLGTKTFLPVQGFKGVGGKHPGMVIAICNVPWFHCQEERDGGWPGTTLNWCTW